MKNTYICILSVTFTSSLLTQSEPKSTSPISKWRLAKEYAAGYKDWLRGAYETRFPEGGMGPERYLQEYLKGYLDALYGKYFLSRPEYYEKNYEPSMYEHWMGNIDPQWWRNKIISSISSYSQPGCLPPEYLNMVAPEDIERIFRNAAASGNSYIMEKMLEKQQEAKQQLNKNEIEQKYKKEKDQYDLLWRERDALADAYKKYGSYDLYKQIKEKDDEIYRESNELKAVGSKKALFTEDLINLDNGRPLYRAISLHNPQAVKFLLDNGAHINAMVWDDPNRGGYETPYREAQSFVWDSEEKIGRLTNQLYDAIANSDAQEIKTISNQIQKAKQDLLKEKEILQMIEQKAQEKNLSPELPKSEWQLREAGYGRKVEPSKWERREQLAQQLEKKTKADLQKLQGVLAQEQRQQTREKAHKETSERAHKLLQHLREKESK